jgi:outer membrane protein assembly factor BamE
MSSRHSAVKLLAPTARALRVSRVVALFCSMLALAGCGNVSSFRFPGVYRIDIPQGNIITQEMVDQLRPGLTKRQVNFILGTPLIRDTFDQDRWDYVYSYQPGGGERVQERIVVFFDENGLVRFDGDFTQSPGKEQFGQPQQATNTADSANQ